MVARYLVLGLRMDFMIMPTNVPRCEGLEDKDDNLVNLGLRVSFSIGHQIVYQR
jgi:hypothetical protein